MPSNRFDQSSGQQYVSTYAELPLNLIGKLAKDHQDKFDKSLDDIDKTKNLIKIKADPRNQEYANKIQTKTNNALTELSDEISRTGYTPEAKRKFNAITNEFVNNPDRIGIEQDAKNYYDRYVKDYDDLNKKQLHSEEIYGQYKGSGSPDKRTPFDYVSLKGKVMYDDAGKSLVANIHKDSGASEGYKRDPNDPTKLLTREGKITKNGMDWENVSDTKVGKVTADLAPAFLKGEGSGWFIDETLKRDTGKGYDSLDDTQAIGTQRYQENYKDPKTGKIKQRIVEKSLTEKGYVTKKAQEYLERLAAPQIFDSKKYSVDLQNDNVDEGPENSNNGQNYLPSFEGNPDTTPTTNKGALSAMGINTTHLNDKGEVDYNAINTTPENIQKMLAEKTKEYKEGKLETSRYLREVENIQKYLVPKSGSNQKIAIDFYSDLARTANNVGIDVSKYTKDGKVNWNKVKEELITSGKAIQTNAPSIQGLQAKFAEDLSKFYFGEHSDS